MSAKENNSDFCRESTGRPTATSIVDGGPTSSGPRLGSGSAGGVPDAPSEGLGEPDGDADASALGESASAGSPVGAEDSPSAVTNAATLSTPENQPPTTGPPEPLQRLGDADDAPGPPEADGSTGSVGSGSAGTLGSGAAESSPESSKGRTSSGTPGTGVQPLASTSTERDCRAGIERVCDGNASTAAAGSACSGTGCTGCAGTLPGSGSATATDEPNNATPEGLTTGAATNKPETTNSDNEAELALPIRRRDERLTTPMSRTTRRATTKPSHKQEPAPRREGPRDTQQQATRRQDQRQHPRDLHHPKTRRYRSVAKRSPSVPAHHRRRKRSAELDRMSPVRAADPLDLLGIGETVLEGSEVWSASAFVLFAKSANEPAIELPVHGPHELWDLAARWRQEQLAGGLKVTPTCDDGQRPAVIGQACL